MGHMSLVMVARGYRDASQIAEAVSQQRAGVLESRDPRECLGGDADLAVEAFREMTPAPADLRRKRFGRARTPSASEQESWREGSSVRFRARQSAGRTAAHGRQYAVERRTIAPRGVGSRAYDQPAGSAELRANGSPDFVTLLPALSWSRESAQTCIGFRLRSECASAS